MSLKNFSADQAKMKQKIRSSLESSLIIKKKLIAGDLDKIAQIAKTVISALKKGGKIIFFGNGGSAADSQHLAAELVGRFCRERKAIPALALTTDTSVLTSLANDYGYDIVFKRQLEALANKKDVAIGISTSGMAKNVILAIKQAKKMGLVTIALTGKGGGELAKICDIALIVDSSNTAHIQESHISVGHIICDLAEEALS